MKYIWSKSRKKAARELTTFVVGVIITMNISNQKYNMFVTHLFGNDLLAIFLYLLALIGFLVALNSLRVLLIYKPDKQ